MYFFYQNYFKRILDLIFSSLALLLTIPIMFILILFSSIDTKSFGLFRQQRIGLNQKPFYIYKIKTMINEDISDQGIGALSSSRVTTLGSFLRKNHLDEFPQFFLVFIGSMSVIGPRPEVIEIINLLPLEDRILWTSVRPGLISPASLKFINEESLLLLSSNPGHMYTQQILPTKLEMNLEYVNNISFYKDVKIFFEYMILIINILIGKKSNFI